MTLGLFLRAPLRVDVLVCISKWHAKGQLTLTIFIHQSLPEWPNSPLLMNGNCPQNELLPIFGAV